MSNEERAKLWDSVFNCELHIIPPYRESDKQPLEWIARTVGGNRDRLRLVGNGRTPEEAVKAALEGGTRDEAV